MTEVAKKHKEPAASSTDADGIRIRGLSVSVAGRSLLEEAEAEFPGGDVTLVVGASGSGKTVLMKILAGLIRSNRDGFSISGSIEIDGRDALRTPGNGTDVGIVFQNFALFDELTAEENIRFAVDHRRHEVADDARLDPRSLLEEFRIPARTPVRSLSGGQQQRLAVARTIAYDPPVVVYDEPTSGLDSVNATRVAGRIQDTCRRHGKTTVVVTHDYHHLQSIADRVYVLDPEGKRLTRVEVDALDDLAADLPGSQVFEDGVDADPPSLGRRMISGALSFLETSGAALDRTAATAFALVPRWRSLRWGLRYFAYYLRLVASLSSWVYFGAAGIIAGFVATYFSYEFLPHRNFSEPLIGDDLLHAVGFALYRIVVPVLVSVLVAARCGAAVASDVGNRAYGHQLDAMRSLGAPPARYLLTNVLFAFLVGTPIVMAIGFLCARLTSLVVFIYHHGGLQTSVFWERHFDRDLVQPGEILLVGTGWLLAKTLLCGLGVGSIAYFKAVRPKSSGVEVSRGITNTVIWATLFVLLVHFAFAFVEFGGNGS